MDAQVLAKELENDHIIVLLEAAPHELRNARYPGQLIEDLDLLL